MKKWVIALSAVVVLIMFALVAMRMMAPPPGDLDVARSKATANGLYIVSVEPQSEPIQQGALHVWIATITSADGEPVEDAMITIDGGMPQHGHGLPTAPQASAHQGEGRYLLEGVRFNMGGWWELKLAITSDIGQDDVTFNIVL